MSFGMTPLCPSQIGTRVQPQKQKGRARKGSPSKVQALTGPVSFS